MANITLTSLGQIKNVETGRVFKDLHLDLQFGIPGGVAYFDSNVSSDALADFDEQAIRNSLITLFNTSKGQKILNPEYGSNLQRFLFLPVSNDNAELLGDAVIDGIRRYEPRVVADKIMVYKDEDNNLYEIDILLIIPALKNATIQLVGRINNSGFTFI